MKSKELKEQIVIYSVCSLGLYFLAFLAFTKAERDSVVFGRDEGKCQSKVPHKCNQEEGLELDHLLPQAYCYSLGIDPDFPENSLTKCKNAHDIKHPERVEARRNYHKKKADGENTFKEMSQEHKDKLKNKQIYWNDKYDRIDLAIALKRTQDAIKRGWKFNTKRSNTLKAD